MHQPMSTTTETDRAVEDHGLACRPRLDLAPAEVAPGEVGDDGDRDHEREPEQRARRGERGLLVQDDDQERDDREDRQVADERVDVPHAVIQARTASAAATSVAPANQPSRARGSVGAYSQGASTAASANVP